jgi:hypothetical protein
MCSKFTIECYYYKDITDKVTCLNVYYINYCMLNICLSCYKIQLLILLCLLHLNIFFWFIISPKHLNVQLPPHNLTLCFFPPTTYRHWTRSSDLIKNLIPSLSSSPDFNPGLTSVTSSNAYPLRLSFIHCC